MISGLPALSHGQQQAVERIHELMADGMSSGESIALVASEIRASHTSGNAFARFEDEDPQGLAGPQRLCVTSRR